MTRMKICGCGKMILNHNKDSILWLWKIYVFKWERKTMQMFDGSHPSTCLMGERMYRIVSPYQTFISGSQLEILTAVKLSQLPLRGHSYVICCACVCSKMVKIEWQNIKIHKRRAILTAKYFFRTQFHDVLCMNLSKKSSQGTSKLWINNYLKDKH